jgi:DNA-directed RNA polymerase specialized sigma24 family protein
MSQHRSGRVNRLQEDVSGDEVDFAANGRGGTLLAAGRSEAKRCGVDEDEFQDFLSEYLIGCWLSPDRENTALTCTCGANRARSFLRKERLWRQRVALVTPHQLPTVVEYLQGSSSATSSLTPEGWVLLQELQDWIQKTLGELTTLQQKMLYLRYVEKLSFAQIATQTGQTLASAKVLVRRGQRRLVSLLEGEDFARCKTCLPEDTLDPVDASDTD